MVLYFSQPFIFSSIHEGLGGLFLILVSSALSLIYIWKLIEGLWYGNSDNKDPKIKEIPEIYIPLLIITVLNIYFGIDASLIVENSFLASGSLLDGIK